MNNRDGLIGSLAIFKSELIEKDFISKVENLRL